MRWSQALCVWLAVHFACSTVLAEPTETPQDDMGEKLQRAEDDQKDHLPPLETVKSSIIPQAGETELANGDGDISTIGACEADIAMQCTDIEPGEGRLADCLRYHITQKALGNTSGRVVTHECQKAVLKFMKDQGLNVNKNVRLALACKADADRLCKGASPDGPVLTGTAPRVKVLACLRKKKAQLAPGCAKRVLDAQMAAAEDFHADQELDAACSEDAEKQCSDVEPGRGRIQACLDVENADDMRLSARLFNACANDKARYCADMDYGLSRVKDCLEEHLEDPHFSTACKAEFAKMMESRSMDFRLNTALKQACAEDVTKMCGFEAESLGAVKNVDSRVILCLQDLRDELHSEACQKQMHDIGEAIEAEHSRRGGAFFGGHQVKKTIERAGRDIRLNQPLADACFNDRKTFCQDVAPGSAQVIRCLQESRSELSEDCRATLFDHEVRMAENIDFDYPLRRACAYELKTVCGNAPHGHSLAIRCLEEHQDGEDLSEECRAEVKRHVHDMSEDYRLNARLSQACGIDVEALCAESCSQLLGQACGGTVLRCLQDRYDEISEANCKKEVFYFMQMEVSDFKNDVLMAQACRADVDQHCAEVEPGEGRVFECLKQHWEQLSEECAAEELKLAVLQSKDVRLRPKLTKLCSEEMAVFCKKVPPGKGRVFSCLMQHITEPSFGSGCKEELEKREDRLKTDWRLNAGVHAECEADVDRLCAEEKSQAHSHAEVLLCLVANLPAVQPACASEMSKLVRMAFWDYSPGSYLTRACDEDVAKVCPSKAAEKARQVYGIGTVGHCLSKQLAERKPLAPQCHQLVLVAAPKDIRSFIAASDSAQSMASSFANIQMQALELSHSFVQGTSFITLSGWVAVASIAALFILLLGAAVVFYRRQTGLSLTGHTVYLPTKSGDA